VWASVRTCDQRLLGQLSPVNGASYNGGPGAEPGGRSPTVIVYENATIL
jgi:hypothetical protein